MDREDSGTIPDVVMLQRDPIATAVDPGLPVSLLVTFPGLLFGEGVNVRSRVNGLTTLDYIIRPL